MLGLNVNTDMPNSVLEPMPFFRRPTQWMQYVEDLPCPHKEHPGKGR